MHVIMRMGMPNIMAFIHDLRLISLSLSLCALDVDTLLTCSLSSVMVGTSSGSYHVCPLIDTIVYG